MYFIFKKDATRNCVFADLFLSVNSGSKKLLLFLKNHEKLDERARKWSVRKKTEAEKEC